MQCPVNRRIMRWAHSLLSCIIHIDWALRPFVLFGEIEQILILHRFTKTSLKSKLLYQMGQIWSHFSSRKIPHQLKSINLVLGYEIMRVRFIWTTLYKQDTFLEEYIEIQIVYLCKITSNIHGGPNKTDTHYFIP